MVVLGWVNVIIARRQIFQEGIQPRCVSAGKVRDGGRWEPRKEGRAAETGR